MKTQHTPGPWSEDPEGERYVSIEGADGSVVCDVHGASDDPLCEANCALIAAAPDLLAALEVIANSEEMNGDSFVCDFATLQSVARKALKRVEST